MPRVRCPCCESDLVVEDDHLGDQVECGKCGWAFVAQTKRKTASLRRQADPRYADEVGYSHPSDWFAEAEAAVKPPGIALIVATTIGMFLHAFNFLMTTVLGKVLPRPFGDRRGVGKDPEIAIPDLYGGLGDLLGIGLSLIVLVGAIQMLRMRTYPFALTASIVSLVPWTGCCLLNIPFGIWALVALVRPDVQAAFKATRLND